MEYNSVDRQPRVSWSLLLAALVGLAPAARAAPLPADFTVEGRLYDASGAPLNTNVDLKIELTDEASPGCVLYREVRANLDLTSADASAVGLYSVRFGAVTPSFAAGSLTTLFAPGTFAGDGCTATAADGSHRLLHVSVKRPSDATFEVLAPDTRVTAVPVAKVAENSLSLQGVGTSSLLMLNGSTSLRQVNLEYLFTDPNYLKLKSLVDGGSTQYIPAAPTSAVDLNGQRLTDLAAPTTPSDAVTKQYADLRVAGQPTDVSAIGPMTGNDAVLRWDATNVKWVAGPANGAPTGPAGGDLTGTYPNPSIADGAIITAKIADAAITSKKISPSVAVNRLVITDATTGSALGFGSCAVNEVYVWGTNGWACTSAASLAAVQSVAGRTGAVTLNAADVSGLGTAALKDYGTGANQIVQLTPNAQYPAVDGSLITGVNAVKWGGRGVSSVAPTEAQVLAWNQSTAQWEPRTPAAGTVVRIETLATTGLLGGTITSVGTLGIDVGTTPQKIVQLNGSAQIALMSGSVTAPAYSFVALPNTGMFLTSGTLGLATQGAARVAITPAGNVGIGTMNPAYTLQVSGSASAATLCIAGDCRATWPGGSVTSVSSNSDIAVATPTTTPALTLNVGTAANQIVKLTGAAKLPIVDGSNLTNVNAASILNKPVVFASMSAGNVLEYDGTSWVNAVLDGGNFSSSIAKNSVFAAPTGGSGAPSFRALDSTDLPSDVVRASGSGASNTNYLPYFSAAATLAKSPLYTSAGNVGIGTTTLGATLDVAGSVRATSLVVSGNATGFFSVMTNTTTAPPTVLLGQGGLSVSVNRSNSKGEVNFWNTANNPQAGFQFTVKDSGATNGYRDAVLINNPQGNTYTLEVSGAVQSSNFVTTTSDGRLKTNVATLDHALENVLSLRGVSYEWIDPERGRGPQIGFIAQELEPIYPMTVLTGRDGLKSVDYMHLLAPVVEAIKTLYDRLTGVDARVRRLEDENAALKARLTEIERALSAR